MSKNIAILFEISVLAMLVNILNNILSYLPKAFINQYWIDLIICIASMIICLLCGSYLIDALFDNIRGKLKGR